jgi:uracil-DNA glycosylase
VLGPDERRERLADLAGQIDTCTQCRLGLTRKRAVPGEGPLPLRLFILGEAPGAQEDATGRPFVGASGRLLRAELLKVGLDPMTVFITSVVKCRPPENRPPRADEIAICTSLYLDRQIELLEPVALLVLGATAAQAVLADPVRMTQEHGAWRRDYALTARDLPVFLTFHPAAALRNPEWRAGMRADLQCLAADLAKL